MASHSIGTVCNQTSTPYGGSMSDGKSLGQHIRSARERQMPKMSQLQLSRLVGVSTVKTVNNWENDRSTPKNRMGRLEQILGDLGEGDRNDPFALEKAEIRALRRVSHADKEAMIATLYATPEGPQPHVRRQVTG